MLTPLPGGHFANPTTVDAVTHIMVENEALVCLLFRSGETMTTKRVVGTYMQTPPLERVEAAVAETAAVINAALSAGVEKPPAPLPADLRAVALEALRVSLEHTQYAYYLMKERSQDNPAAFAGADIRKVLADRQQDVVTVQKAITLLEANQPEA